MNIPDELPESVRRLVLPRLALRAEKVTPADVIVGVWGGSGVIPLSPDRTPILKPSDEGCYPRHWISVDCAWLERNGFSVRGCLSVYEVGCLKYVVVNDPGRVFPNPAPDGLALFGQEELSLPDDEVLAAYLTEDELRALEAGEYASELFTLAKRACPLFRKGLVAVFGGWHISWPDGPPPLPRLGALNERIDAAHGPGCLPPSETYRCEPYRLLLWTLRDSEPWVEVWGDGTGELHAVGRIT